MGQPLLRTGEFARASSLSLKALRLYHDIGLLVPAVVDPHTGYRAYSPSQLVDAAVIQRLRSIGVGLQEIREMLEARDPVVTRKVLGDHAEVLRSRLDDVTRLLDDLGSDVTDPTDVVLRHEPARTAVVVDGHPLMDDLGAFILRSAQTLEEAVRGSGGVVEGSLGAVYPIPLDDGSQPVTVFLPITAPVVLSSDARAAGARIEELPECDMAVLEHCGPYEELEDAYRRLGTWVALHAVRAGESVREIYRHGPEPGGQPVTDLLWPVVMEER